MDAEQEACLLSLPGTADASGRVPETAAPAAQHRRHWRILCSGGLATAAIASVIAGTAALRNGGTSSSEPSTSYAFLAFAEEKPAPSPAVACSWPSDDCTQTKCCSGLECDWGYSGCKSYSCYAKDDNWSGCRTDKAPWYWKKGNLLGGPMATQDVAKADVDAKVHGTSLYCIMVVLWSDASEAALANNEKTKGVGIYQCDGHATFEGVKTKGAGYGSFANRDLFIKVWKEVKAAKVYQDHDWVVKKDADCVFFPSLLKAHLAGLRTPLGAKAYLRNNYDRFHFAGSLEVLTHEALDLYFANGWQCQKQVDSKNREDYYMRVCLDAIGVDHQTDFVLLHDSDAKQTGCSNGWKVGFHSHKTADDWNSCYNTALEAQKAAAVVEKAAATKAKEDAAKAKVAADAAKKEAGEKAAVAQKKSDGAAKAAKEEWNEEAAKKKTAKSLEVEVDKSKAAVEKAEADKKTIEEVLSAIDEVKSKEKKARAMVKTATEKSQQAAAEADGDLSSTANAAAQKAKDAATRGDASASASSEAWVAAHRAAADAQTAAATEVTAAKSLAKAAAAKAAAAQQMARAEKHKADEVQGNADRASKAAQHASAEANAAGNKDQQAGVAMALAGARKEAASTAEVAVQKMEKIDVE